MKVLDISTLGVWSGLEFLLNKSRIPILHPHISGPFGTNVDIEFEYFTGIPDVFTKVAGPFSVIGLETEAGGAHFYANIEDLEIELEPGQVIGVEGVQIGYK